MFKLTCGFLDLISMGFTSVDNHISDYPWVQILTLKIRLYLSEFLQVFSHLNFSFFHYFTPLVTTLIK